MPTVAVKPVPTTEIVEQILKFCSAYSGRIFYPYQSQFMRRVAASVLDNDGEELTALFARQSGKTDCIASLCGGLAVVLPFMAKLPQYRHDARLQRFKNGILIGIFAPILDQAQTTFDRLRGRLTCAEAEAVFSVPALGVRMDTNNGNCVGFSNGSSILCMSASEQSHIESKTFHMVIAEEAQEISNSKMRKSISPMLASTNGTLIKIGTAFTSRNDFYDGIQRNKRKLNETGVKNHFEYDYTIAQKYNPLYAKYIEKEMYRLGFDSVTADRCVTVRKSGNVQIVPIERLFEEYKSTLKVDGDKEYVFPHDLECLGASKVSAVAPSKMLITSKQLVALSMRNSGATFQEIKDTVGGNAEKVYDAQNRLSKVAIPEWGPVKSIMRHHISKSIRRLSQSGMTCVTDDHSVMELCGDALVSVPSQKCSSMVSLHKIPHSTITELNIGKELRKYNISNLVIKDEVYLLSHRDSIGQCRIPSVIKADSPKMKALARLLGAFVAEGFVLKRGLDSGICNNEIWWLKQLQKDAFDVFGMTFPIRHAGHGCYKLCTQRAVPSLIFKHFCGQGSLHKKVPWFIFNMPRDVQAEFFKQSLIGDGTMFRKSSWVYTTVSSELASGLQTLCTMMGLPCRAVYSAGKTKNHNPVYTLHSRDEGVSNARLPVKHTPFHYTGYVYDLCCPTHHSFVDSMGQVLLHNSDEFRMSYRLHWILERGMFISPDQLEKLGLDYNGKPYDIVEMRKNSHQVAGLDIAKVSDSTVLTIMEVDYNNVSPEGFFYKRILNWLEIFGDDHESQFYQIKDFLANYNVEKMCVDVTGVGDPVHDRLAAALPNINVIPYSFNRSSKSDLYKYLLNDLSGGRIRYPNTPEVQKIRRQRKFISQLLDLEKSYVGEYMVCEHPNERDAHDDFPDSMALANWAAKEEGICMMEMSPGGLR
jgi:hypothetical protein